MKQFFTREKANEGIEVPLYLPNGDESGEWMRLRGVDSDEYQRVYAEARRKLANAASSKNAKAALAEIDKEDETLTLLCSLVISWSFKDYECNDENKRKLFTEAPQLADMVSRVTSQRSLFFAKQPENSAPSPEVKSS